LQPVAINANAPRPKTAETSQIRCSRLPPVAEEFHGKQGVCRGLPPRCGRSPPCEGGGRSPLKRQVLRTRRPTGLDRDLDRRTMARQAERRAAVDDRGRYARIAGHIVPGRCRGGEVRCESGAVPQLRCPARGRARSTVLRRNERQPSEEGRFGRRPAAGPPPPQTRRFS
jgi:hypothetical protein